MLKVSLYEIQQNLCLMRPGCLLVLERCYGWCGMWGTYSVVFSGTLCLQCHFFIKVEQLLLSQILVPCASVLI